jgi:hypothetical protein
MRTRLPFSFSLGSAAVPVPCPCPTGTGDAARLLPRQSTCPSEPLAERRRHGEQRRRQAACRCRRRRVVGIPRDGASQPLHPRLEGPHPLQLVCSSRSPFPFPCIISSTEYLHGPRWSFILFFDRACRFRFDQSINRITYGINRFRLIFTLPVLYLP